MEDDVVEVVDDEDLPLRSASGQETSTRNSSRPGDVRVVVSLCSPERKPSPLKRGAIGSTGKQDIASSFTTCSICLEPMCDNLKALTCGHVFHAKCFDEWATAKRSGPVCPFKCAGKQIRARGGVVLFWSALKQRAQALSPQGLPSSSSDPERQETAKLVSRKCEQLQRRCSALRAEVRWLRKRTEDSNRRETAVSNLAMDSSAEEVRIVDALRDGEDEQDAAYDEHNVRESWEKSSQMQLEAIETADVDVALAKAAKLVCEGAMAEMRHTLKEQANQIMELQGQLKSRNERVKKLTEQHEVVVAERRTAALRHISEQKRQARDALQRQKGLQEEIKQLKMAVSAATRERAFKPRSLAREKGNSRPEEDLTASRFFPRDDPLLDKERSTSRKKPQKRVVDAPLTRSRQLGSEAMTTGSDDSSKLADHANSAASSNELTAPGSFRSSAGVFKKVAVHPDLFRDTQVSTQLGLLGSQKLGNVGSVVSLQVSKAARRRPNIAPPLPREDASEGDATSSYNFVGYTAPEYLDTIQGEESEEPAHEPDLKIGNSMLFSQTASPLDDLTNQKRKKKRKRRHPGLGAVQEPRIKRSDNGAMSIRHFLGRKS